MTQEEKQLLLKDLCARLPYKVNIQVKDWTVLEAELKIGHIDRLQHDEIELKPYLRSMSSMTDEEKKEYFDVASVSNHCAAVDWLNSHHFDYRGLIPIGLALEAPKDMYV